MAFTIAVFLGALVVLICLAAGTDVLRRGAKGRSAAQGSPRTPLSLGRLQMAWWSAITLASFLALASNRHQIGGVMNRQTVIVLAIAAATLLAATWMDLIARTSCQPASRHFVADLLCDGEGLCVHRLQLLVWNVVLGMAFVWTVATDASMPTFDDYTLGVLAISDATYVGFKGQESITKTTQG